MKSNEFYLQQLKYYKGEKESPYDDNVKSMLWFYESIWFFDTIRGYDAMLAEYISDFRMAELSDLPGDMPLGYKALLFNRYMKGSMSSMLDTAKEFRAFYAKYY